VPAKAPCFVSAFGFIHAGQFGEQAGGIGQELSPQNTELKLLVKNLTPSRHRAKLRLITRKHKPK
jgi:hypothetical protein